MPTTLSISDVNSLKTKVKAEMLRRNSRFSGSLAAYGAAGYDFSTTPSSGVKILTEHGSKTINLLLLVKDYPNVCNSSAGQKIPSGFTASNLIINGVNVLETESITGNTSSCRGACTGLC